MDSLYELFGSTGSVAHTILILSLILCVGILLGKIKIFGISLGMAWILFAGIFFGHLGLEVDMSTLQFIKQVSMVVFIYAIGMQVGPGFFASFKEGGITLNILAVSVVFIGVLITYLIHIISGTPIEIMVGIMSGAVTNTPGLGAAQETYQSITGHSNSSIAMGYAVAYPMAITGIIITFGLIRWIFKINYKQEEEELLKAQNSNRIEAKVYSLEVVNPQIFGKNIKYIQSVIKNSFVISRIQHFNTGQIEMVKSETILNKNDKILIVANEENLDILTTIIGNKIEMTDKDWTKLNSQIVSRRFIVSQPKINGKTIRQLNLRSLYGVNISRINRAGLNIIATPDLKIQIGDRVTVVGEEKALLSTKKVLGDSIRTLNTPNLFNIFLGVALGVILGSISFTIPGVPQAMKLGISGGVLISSILISNFGAKYKLIIYNPASTTLMLREMGIAMFLVCVGLSAGKNFINILLDGGYIWTLYGGIITILPLLIVGVIGRWYCKLNYFTLVGLLSGSVTLAAALAFSKETSDNPTPAVKYTTVFPLTMLLRVIIPQLILLFFL
ncbi:MAG: putative transporter [Flavobacteriaceae bacterium]|nr:putative transporter [Flavobacteriaceae bacterium]